ncbi:hypothetical protein [Flexithrix dorotheae]|uniref:hypothetical protein n=1 Tax=Flexithrix dorotheae TaxID=70993 RepID=UPI0003AA01EE|nr:hypothetical protein [Flexithrix dorotheae]
MKSKFKYNLFLIFTLLILGTSGIVYGQGHQNGKNFEVDLGLGFPDLLHLGMKYQFTNLSKIGMSYGSLIATSKTRNTYAVTLEHEYHFGKLTEKSTLPPYYFTQKITYLRDFNKEASSTVFYLTPSIGKVFFSEGPFGINLDAGLNFKLHQNKTINSPSKDNVSNNYPAVFPAIRFQFFFML